MSPKDLGAPGTPPPKNLVRHLHHRFHAMADQDLVAFHQEKYCGKMINSEYPPYHPNAAHGMNAAAAGMIPHGPPTSPPPIGNGNGAGGFHYNPNMRMMPPPPPQNMAAAVPLFPLYYH